MLQHNLRPRRTHFHTPTSGEKNGKIESLVEGNLDFIGAGINEATDDRTRGRRRGYIRFQFRRGRVTRAGSGVLPFPVGRQQDQAGRLSDVR
jgi:hypothetical protein